MKQNLLFCPVCGAPHDELAFQCQQCHSYLQNRIPNINLFETLWLIVERPRTAFKNIARAEHKNYSVALFFFFAYYISFLMFSVFRKEQFADNLLEILTKISLVAILEVCVCTIAVPTIHSFLGKILKGKGTYRNALSLIAYASVPLLFATVFLIPIKLLAFGMYYFTANPHPLVLNPALFWILVILDIICVLWFFVLLILGTKITYQISIARSLFINFLTFFLAFGIVYYSSRWTFY